MLSAEAKPPIDVFRWYDAPPAGTGSRAASQVSGADLVRSQVMGGFDATVFPGSSSTCWSLGAVWQSVDVQYGSSPLDTVNTCWLVPAFIVHAAVPVFVMLKESCGSSSAAKLVPFTIASTVIWSAVHAAALPGSVVAASSIGAVVAGGASLGVGVGVTEGDADDDAAVGSPPDREVIDTINTMTRTMTAISAPNTTRRRRR